MGKLEAFLRRKKDNKHEGMGGRGAPGSAVLGSWEAGQTQCSCVYLCGTGYTVAVQEQEELKKSM